MPASHDRLYRKTRGGQAKGPWYGWYYPELGGRARYVCLGTLDRRAAATRLRKLERQSALAPDPAAHATARSVQAATVTTDASASGITLFDAFVDFLDHGCRDKASQTRDMYVEKARHVLRVLGDDLLLDRITMEDVDVYLATRTREGAHGGTLYKEIVTLRQALKWARRRRKLMRDIAEIIPPVSNVYEPRRTHLLVADCPRLLAALLPHRRWWVIVALYTSARRSVVERMQWDAHVDFETGMVRVPGTKTRGSARAVPMHAQFRAALEAVPAAARTGALVQPWPNVNKDLAAVCTRLEMPRLSPNDLRRTFASWLKQAGTDSMVVAKLMGHASTEMVERVYGQLTDDNYRAAIAKLPDLDVTAGSKRVVTADVAESSQSRSTTAPRERRPRKTPPSQREDGVLRVSPVGIEPTTRGLRVRCSTN
jgi:integrase